jgi:signal transduction histidine kinase
VARAVVRAESPLVSVVRFEATVEDEAEVEASPALLELALQALVDNAVEAQPEGGAVALLVRRDGNDCLLCVRDRGPGLSAQARAHLFEPFWTSKSGHHLGLGLVTARELVQAQGGTLEVGPAPGQGCLVTLTFPAWQAGQRHDEPAALPAPHLDVVTAPLSSLV